MHTQSKRLSMIHILVPSMPAFGDPNNAVISQADRQDFIWLYRGIIVYCDCILVALQADNREFDLHVDNRVAELNVDNRVVELT